MEQQLTFGLAEPAMEMVQLAESMLRDHHWMSKRVNELRVDLGDAGQGMGASGDENSGIRAQYMNSDKVGNEVVRRDRSHRQLKEMSWKVDLFYAGVKKVEEDLMAAVNKDRELTVLDMLVNGDSVTAIAVVIKKSRRHTQDLKALLIRKVAWAMHEIRDGGAGQSAA